MTKESIEKLTKQFIKSFPDGLLSAKEDFEKNVKASLESGLGKLDLVTREEFEVQQTVLKRTREKLEKIEKHLNSLEINQSIKD